MEKGRRRGPRENLDPGFSEAVSEGREGKEGNEIPVKKKVSRCTPGRSVLRKDGEDSEKGGPRLPGRKRLGSPAPWFKREKAVLASEGKSAQCKVIPSAAHREKIKERRKYAIMSHKLRGESISILIAKIKGT